jgi:hypothetical protein
MGFNPFEKMFVKKNKNVENGAGTLGEEVKRKAEAVAEKEMSGDSGTYNRAELLREAKRQENGAEPYSDRVEKRTEEKIKEIKESIENSQSK